MNYLVAWEEEALSAERGSSGFDRDACHGARHAPRVPTDGGEAEDAVAGVRAPVEEAVQVRHLGVWGDHGR